MAQFVIPTIFTAVDRASSTINKIMSASNKAAESMRSKYEEVNKAAQRLAVTSGVVGVAIAAPVVAATKKAMEFQDALSDVAKTTGLQGAALEKFGDAVLSYAGKTRTSIVDLVSIGAIGGSLGIASDQLSDFTLAADKFNIALGDDFGGVDNAVRGIAGLKNLFVQTRDMGAAEQINKVGSAINALTSKGANAPEMANFAARLGALPDAIKPSISETIALSAVLNKANVSAEIAASGFQNFTTLAGKNISDFASHMKMSVGAATELLSTDPSKFALNFASTLQGLNTVQLSEVFSKLKVNSSEVMKTIGSLGSSYRDYEAYLAIANNELAHGNSISEEAAGKNATLAAQMAMAQNNMQAFGITVGTQVIPIVSDLVTQVTPVISSVIEWVKNNKELTKNIVLITAGVAGLAFAISAISGIISGIITIKTAWVAAQTALNVAMAANPMGLLAIAIGVVTAAVVGLIVYWDEIYAKLTDWGIIDGVKKIGYTILDFLLKPLELVLKAASYLPGALGDGAKMGLNTLGTIKTGLTGYDPTSTVATAKPYTPGAVLPFEKRLAAQQLATSTTHTQKSQVELILKGNTDAVGIGSNKSEIPIKMSRSQNVWSGI